MVARFRPRALIDKNAGIELALPLWGFITLTNSCCICFTVIPCELRMMRHYPLCFAVLFVLGFFSVSALAEDTATKPISGYWQTQDNDGVVELYPCEQKICGRFHWLKEDSPEAPSLDDKNPDPEKRSRPLCQMQFMGGFDPQGDGRYTRGWIYSPRHGSTYSARLTLKDPDTVELHGYVFVPLLGDSQIWRRTNGELACRTSGKPVH